MTSLSAVRRWRKAAGVHLAALLPSLWSSKPRAAYCWCDWCGDEWEALGIRDRHGTEIWETSDHNRRCERGGRYVGVAWTPRERARRSGELFPGDL